MALDGRREFDLIVWGASGFTGSLVAEHLLLHYSSADTRWSNARIAPLKWAMGGRNSEKLAALKLRLGPAASDVPVLIANAQDRASLNELTARSRVVCSTVGPFAKYGSELVASCVSSGTHYCDITGEVQWMRTMIDRHQLEAERTGARIVHCCGFDSIPSDLGTWFLQQEAQRLHGTVCKSVSLRVRRMRGTFSGGTFASLLNVLDESQRDPRVRQIVHDPYALNPEGQRFGPDTGDLQDVKWDPDVKSWIAPFVMAPINTRVVRRSNAVMQYPYGQDFRYDEAVLTGGNWGGWGLAQGLNAGTRAFLRAASFKPTRQWLHRYILPSPGQGPSEKQREAGSFDILLLGRPDAESRTVYRVRVTGNRDPGYGSTSRMLGESAVCLAMDADEFLVGGGFWTPASCLGRSLIDRLQSRAGMSFELGPIPTALGTTSWRGRIS